MSPFVCIKAIYKSTLSSLGLSNDQWSPVTCTNFGALYTAISGPSGGAGADVVDVDTTPFENDGSARALVVENINFAYSVSGDQFNPVSVLDGAEARDGVAATLAGAGYLTASMSMGYNSTSGKYIATLSQANNADAVAAVTDKLRAANAYPFLYNGATFDRQRGMNVSKSVLVSASGDTTLWDPAAGKKVRLMGLSISASGTAASLVADLLKITDGAGGTVKWQGYIAVNTTVTGDTQIFADFGQGILFTTDNNVVANLATAFSAGGAACNLWGTEE